MEWKDEYALGISVVDAQHKQLFRLSGELDQKLSAGIQPEEIDAMLVHMGEYAARHFTMEEKYMAESNYPGLKEQKDAHKAFSALFTELYEKFKKTGPTEEVTATLRMELVNWIKDHVSGLDQRFGDYYSLLNAPRTPAGEGK